MNETFRIVLLAARVRHFDWELEQADKQKGYLKDHCPGTPCPQSWMLGHLNPFVIIQHLLAPSCFTSSRLDATQPAIVLARSHVAGGVDMETCIHTFYLCFMSTFTLIP